MVKVIVLLHRRPGMSREEFLEYWRTKHAPLLLKLPGLRRLVFNHPQPGPDGELAYDGISEDWFESVEAMGAAIASPEGQAVTADTPNFVDTSRMQLVVAEEEEISPPAQ
jgi:uncharacterized protein (TIGR02118 family)